MAIWQKKFTLAALNATSQNTLISHLGIQYSAFDEGSLSATMAVTAQTHQPIGLLHGGASVALAETVGSIAANLCVGENQYCVGLEINANHLRSVKQGIVSAKATPLHLGTTTQVWQIHLTNDKQQLFCISRLTLSVMNK